MVAVMMKRTERKEKVHPSEDPSSKAGVTNSSWSRPDAGASIPWSSSLMLE